MFLYPDVWQFPFDSTCERIVHELEKRDWKVPGVSVVINSYGNDCRYVSRITGRDFALRFCRFQRRIFDSQWNDIAGITEIVIPRKELRVHEDESGPTFYLYVGDDYERDREAFMHGSKVNSKLYGIPRMYLQYAGQCVHSRFDVGIDTHRKRRAALLLHTNDWRREYDPVGDEPRSFRTEEVMAEFTQYLEDVVLAMITAHSICATTHQTQESRET